MKQLKALRSANKNILNIGKRAVVRDIRHSMWVSPLDNDKITIPLCGTIVNNAVAKNGTIGITCPDCIQRMIELAPMDSYDDALVHVTSYAPEVMQPDMEEVNKSYGSQGISRDAEKHHIAHMFLKNKYLAKAADLPQNIIGSTPETYYYNMTELDLVDDDGEPNETKVAELQGQLDGLLSEQEQPPQ